MSSERDVSEGEDATSGAATGCTAGCIVAFGELLLRLSPPGPERFFQTPRLETVFGGSEANVAVSLAHFGHRARFVTRLPANPIGDAALAALRAEGLDVSQITRGGARMGLYFVETGASQRPGRVVYDRAGSSFADLAPGDLDGESALDGAAWVHTSGITPALSPGARDAAAELLRHASLRGLPASFDVNYRAKLWTEAEARAAIPPLLDAVTLLIANEDHLATCLGVPVEADPSRGDLDLDAYAGAARRVADQHGLRHVAITLRESFSASDNGWAALLYERERDLLHRSPRYDVRLVDRIGGGDAFAAGLIHGFRTGWSAGDTLAFAVAAGALKQTIPGDFNRVSAEEVERLAGGDASGRVQR